MKYYSYREINLMKNRKILQIGLLSILLSTVAIGAEHGDCTGGACFATLANIKPEKVVEEKKQLKSMKHVEKIKYVENDNSNTNIDKSKTIILDGEKVTLFPPETYVMNEEESIDFLLTANPIEAIDDKILEKTNLPSSEYFCENNKQPVYLNNDIYECV